jgi:lipopolysaccharide/colanic/teichoic acid biosynthesis glycosyltransferase
MKTTVILALLIAIVGRFMADEVKAWSDWLIKSLRRIAVRKLPAECKERYEEEWESAVAEIPGNLFKLFYSMGLLRAAIAIRGTTRKRTSDGSFDLPKRLFDIVFAGVTLIVLAPVLLAIAIGIKLDTPGPVFYSSARIGKRGRVFRCTKFRTMEHDADNWCTGTMSLSERGGVLFKISNNPRITSLGRLLRKYSLDELPQFFNVLRGDMSVVGPRPPIATEIKDYKLSDLRCLDVMPGLIGLWQLEGQNKSFESSEFLDEVYARNSSMWLDFRIIMRTVAVAFVGRRFKPGSSE